MGYPDMTILLVIAMIILFLILFLILLSPFIAWALYSYIFSKLILSLAKHYFNANISFSRIWAITFLLGLISTFITLFPYSSLSIIHILEFTAVIIFITSLIAYKFLSNVSLKAAIVMSFVTTLAYLPFIVMVHNMINILIYLTSLRACCT